jgi:AAA+ ATPase superfamily predicted ATPase
MFQAGIPVTGKEFIDRAKNLKELKYYLDNKQNIMLQAPRRFGKTSLILQVLENNDYKYIYVDIKRVIDRAPCKLPKSTHNLS